MVRRVPQMIDQYSPMMKELGILDAENRLDIDILYEEALKSIERTPVIVAGYRADRSDIEKLKSIMEKYGV